MRSTVHRTTVFTVLLLLLYAPQGSFSQQEPPAPPPFTVPGGQRDTGPSFPSQVQKEMEKKANEQRQADLKRDTAKLLKLSTELKEYVDKSNENVLSLDVIKKAEEIEKLAHSVKTKMRGDY
jgi:hypothetical protein